MNRRANTRLSRFSYVLGLIALTVVSGLAITATSAGAAGVRFGFVESVASWFGGETTTNRAQPEPTPENEAPMTNAYHSLATSNFSQNWSTTSGLITTIDDWSGVPSILGYLGDGLLNATTGSDPQLIFAPASVLDVIPQSTGTSGTGGVHEVEVSQVVSLQGSASADAPHLVLHLDSTGRQTITVTYKLRQLDNDNPNQRFAIQFRNGASGNFLNIPNSGTCNGAVNNVFNGAGQEEFDVSCALPVTANNQAQLQVRIITVDSTGSDANVGVDDIVVSSVAMPSTLTCSTGGAVSIPDDAYNGSLGSMVSKSISVPQFGSVTNVEVRSVTMNHTYVGDLTMKLVSPTGTVLTVLNRPFSTLADNGSDGPPSGSTADLLTSYPIEYRDTASTSAESLGSVANVCLDNGICSFAPAPDTAVTPPTNFAGFNGLSANGNWTLYVGDGAGADTGSLTSWCIDVQSTGVQTRYVDDTGSNSGPNNCLTLGSPCATVSHAIAQANTGDTISIAEGTYTEANILVNKNLTIDGAGASSTIVQANASPNSGAGRVFNFDAGVSGTLSDLTVRHGDSNAGAGGGMYLESGGAITLSNLIVTANRGTSGTGGAGIYTSSITTINNCTISGNSNISTLGGGGIYVGVGSTTTINNSTISGNSATTIGGGGIYATGSTTLNNVTVSGNTTNASGGGIFVTSAPTININYSTIANNQSDSNNDSSGDGGGISLNSGTANVKSSIIAGNKKANSTTSTVADCYVNVGTVATQGYNLSGSSTGCTLAGTGDATITPANVFTTVLGALGSNGGATQTHALLGGSPGLDQIPNGTNDCGTAPFNLDQRGTTRPLNSSCDKGAFESLPPPPQVYYRYGTINWSKDLGALPVQKVDFTVDAGFRRSDLGTPAVNDIIDLGYDFDYGDGVVEDARFKVTSVDAFLDIVYGTLVKANGSALTHNYAAAPATYTAFWQGNKRLPTAANFSTNDWRSEITVTILGTVSTKSPKSTSLPLITVADNNISQFTIPAIAYDGYTNTYTVGTQADFFATPAVPATQILPPGLSINSSSGLVTLDIRDSQQAGVSPGQLYYFALLINNGQGVLTPLEIMLSVVAVPEMDVSGNGNAVFDGDTFPSTTNHTDFDSTAVAGGTVVRTFTIANTGGANLNLTGFEKVAVSGANASEFTVTTQPTSPVTGPSGTTTFQVTFDPTAAGVRTATLSIANNDTDENPYDFAIQGAGALASTALADLTVNSTASVGNTLSVSTTLTQTSPPAGAIGGATVSFTLNGPSGPSTLNATTNASGVAAVSFPLTAKGAHTVTANFAGNATQAAASSNTPTVNVYRRTSLSFSGGGGTAGTPITLSATLTQVPSGLPLAGQSVSFDFGGTPTTETATTDASGVATVTPTFPTGGTFSTTTSFSNLAAFYADAAGNLQPTTSTANVTVTTPTITITGHPVTLNFGSVTAGNYSPTQNYTVSGSSLLASVTINAPTGFEISRFPDNGFGTTEILPHSVGNLPPTTIYVRFAPGSAGSFSDVLTHTSTGATQKDVTVTGTGVAAVCTVAPSGMVMWHKANGNANDALGLNNGTLEAGATFSTGKVGQSYSLDGVDDYVSIPETPSIAAINTAISVDAWVKLSGSANQRLVSKLSCCGFRGFNFDIVGGKLRLEVFDAASTRLYLESSGIDLIDGQWHHVAGTYDGSQMILYIDGVQDGAPLSGSVGIASNNGQPVTIGRYTFGDFANGLIDEVEIFNRALSPTDVANIYTAGSAGKCDAQIFTTGATLTDFGSVNVGSTSTEQTYNVEGINLSGSIVVTAPANFEVSLTSGAGFGPSVTLPFTGPFLSPTAVYVRFAPSAAGALGGNIAHTSAGATTVNVPVTGTGLGRNLRIVDTSASAGSQVFVDVELDSLGNEAGISTTVNFDPTKLSISTISGGSNPDVTLGSGAPGGTIVTVNTTQVASGRIGLLVDGVSAFTSSPPARQVVRLRFTVSFGAAAGPTAITFGGTPVPQAMSDTSANSLTANYIGGTLTITPPVRTLRVLDTTAPAGSQVFVDAELYSMGNESAISATVNFDPAKLSISGVSGGSNPDVVLGSGAPGGSAVTVNTSQVASGRIGLLIDSASGTFAASPPFRQVVRLRFTIALGAAAGLTPITFGNVPVPQAMSDPSANSLTAIYQGGNLNITTPGGETAVSLAGGNLTVTDIGTTSNDNLTISCVGANLRIHDPSRAVTALAPAVQIDANTVEIPLASVTGSITVNTLGGDDTLTINLSGCNLIPAGGLFYNGGAAGDDALNISGYSGGTTTYNYLNANDGSIVLAGGTRTGTINYTGLEPIANSGTAADVIMNLPAGGSAALLSIPVAGTTRLESSPVTFETTDFATPSNSLTINPGNAADTISVGAMGSGYPSMTLGATGNRFGSITHGGVTTFASNRNYTAFATGQIQFQAGTVFGIVGSGNFSLTTDRNILVQGTISFQAGSAVLSANQQVTPTAGNFIGIDFDGGSISSTTFTAIPLFVSGKGGTDPSGNQHGIRIQNGGSVIGGSGGFGVGMTGRGGASTGGASANIGVLIDGTNSRISSTGGGTVQVSGFGGSSSSGGSHVGVRVINSGTITSLGNAFINVNGFGGTGSGGAQFGVDVRDGGVISRSFSGQVSVSGTGGDGAGGSNTGVSIVSNGTTSRISSGSGSTIVTGTGGLSGSNNDGINMFRAAQITSTNGGTVTVNGTSGAGSSSEGVQLSGSPTFPAINSGGAAFAEISVTGTAASGIGILIDAGCSVASGSNANVSLIANSMSIETSSASVSAGTGQVSLRQLTNGVGIDLGSASDPAAGPLSLTDAEVDRITADTLNIGNSNSGTIIFNSSINLTDTPIIPNLNLTTGGQIQDSFSGTEITVSNLGMTAGTGGIGQSISGAVDFQADTVWTNTSGTNSNQFMFTSGQVDIVTPGLNAGSGSITIVGGRWDTTATGGVLSDIVVYGNGATVATLGGIGSVSSSESTTANGGIISPGTSPGVLNTGNVSFGTGSIFEVEIGGITPGNAITNHDQLNVTGTVDLAGAALTLAQFNGFTPTAGQQFVIINNDGAEAILNPFGGVAEGATIAPFLIPGMQATISYVGGTGNDVVLTAMLPPAIITLSDPNPIGFGNVTVGNTSPTQTYNVSGVNLTANIVVTAPTHFQVSLSPTTGFGASVSIPFGSGTVTNVPVYIRFVPTAPGVFSDPITHTSGAAPTVNKTALGTGIAAVCTAPPTGMVAWYSAENDANDRFGVNHGTAQGGVTYVTGKVGQTFRLAGTGNTGGVGDRVVIGNPTSFQTQDFTIDAWIRRSSPTVVTNSPVGGFAGGTFFAYGAGGYGFAIDQATNRLNLTKIGTSSVTASTLAITDTDFHHVAVTKSGTQVIFYVDGVASAPISYNPGFTFGTNAAIGARGDNDVRNAFFGDIDELEVFNTALSPADILAIYNASTAGKCPTPDIKVEEPVGTDLTDGVSTVNFGTQSVPVPGTPKTITVRNHGTSLLTVNIGGIFIDGANGGDYSFNTAGMSPTIAPGGNTAFTMTFTPSGLGTRVGAIHIPSDDPDAENPFDINLTGVGGCLIAPVVTTNGNSGADTLRQAVIDACQGATITFAGSVVSPISLSTGQITIDKNLTIDGPATTLIVQNTQAAGATSRVFNVLTGVTATIQDLTISGGNTTAGNNGGGILSNGTLFINNATISNNISTASFGGGLSVDSGSATLTGVIFLSNIGVNGAAAAISSTGSLSVDNSTVRSNIATGTGGGFYNVNGTLAVSNTMIGGTAVQANKGILGGGLVSGGGSLTVTNSQFYRNEANGIVGNPTGVGGAIYVTGSSMAVTGTDFVGNKVTHQSGGVGLGGAIYRNGTTAASISLSRFFGNTATTSGGAVNNNTGVSINAENNWWGCDGVPGSSGCDTNFGVIDADPRIDLRLTRSADPIFVGGTSTLSADLRFNSNNVNIGTVPALEGKTVTLAATGFGTVVPGTQTIASGITAGSLFTSNGTAGVNVASATLDNGVQAGLTVQKFDSTTGVTSSADPSVFGQPVTFTATVAPVAPGVATPTGTVTFFDGASPICTTVALSGGTATCLTSTLTVGNHTITATYNGDASYNTSTGSLGTNPQGVTIASSTSAITNAATLGSTPTVVGQSYAVNVSVAPVAPSAATPTGTVNVSDGTGGSCVITLAGGTGSCNLTSTSAGTKTISATYPGDSGFNGSSTTASHTVNPAATTTTITNAATLASTPTVVGESYAVNWSVAVNGPGALGVALTGNVTVDAGGGNTCVAAVAAGTCNVVSTTAGLKSITASYAGDGNYNGSTSAGAAHTVNPAATTTTITNAALLASTPTVVGQSYAVNWSVAVNSPGALGAALTGNVTVNAGGGNTCVAAVAAGTCNIVSTTAGVKSITATYAGDGNYNGSTSAGAAHTVNPAATTTTITSDAPDPSVTGEIVTVNFTVVTNLPGAGTPPGSVVITVSGGAETCTGTVAAGTCNITLNSAGSRTLTATYAGDSNFSGSSDTETHLVNGAATTTTTISDLPDPSVVGQVVPVTFSVVANPPGSGTPTGNVVITISGGSETCTGTVASGTCNITLTTAGSRTMTATYSGDANFLTSNDTEPHQVNQAATTTTITTDNPDPSLIGDPYTVTWTVTVNLPGAGTPTGTVTVSDGTDSCNAAVGAGSCVLTSNTGGAKTLTATYSGDANFVTSNDTEPHQVDCVPNPVVTNNADNGAGSLRRAVLQACSTAGQNTITFAPGPEPPPGDGESPTVTSPISLSGGQITIDKNVIIQGPGANLLTVQNTAAASATSRVFFIQAGATVQISGLSVSGGNTIMPPGANGGGGVWVDGTLTLIRSSITGNTSSNAGGGIVVANSGILILQDSTISGNTSATSNGGGLQVSNTGAAIVSNSTISGNTATTGEGGGIRVVGTASITLSNSTVTNNTAATGAGGFSKASGAGIATVRSSIIAGNVNNATIPDVIGAFATGGFNLIGNVGTATGFTDGLNADQVGTGASVLDPRLLPLGPNGGPTQTHAVCGGVGVPAGCTVVSPAYDKGSAFGLTLDQRGAGFPRTINNPSIIPATGGDNTDIGAFEIQNTPPTIAAVATTRQAGSPVSNSTIANVTDVESGNGGVVVTVTTANPSNGVTISNIVNTAGVITADVVAACGATTATFTLTATDGGSLTATATLTVTVTANTPPAVTYSSPQTVVFGQSGFTVPTATATDNGSISGYVLQSVVPPMTVAPTVNAANGTVTINAAGPIGAHVITVRSTDNCGLTTDSSFTLNVNKANTTTTVTAAPATSVYGQSVTFTATVGVVGPGAGTPTGTVSFNIDGNIYCANTPLTGLTATCTQAGLPALPAGVRNVVANYNGDVNFNGSTGTLNYTVTKANTTTAITSDLPDPSLVNQPYTVTWTVTAVAPGAGTPTGTVTVNGGTGGGSCTAPVASGSCQLTPTTTGVKTISATYNGDNNFNTSTSTATTHTVNVAISGTVRQAPGMTPIAGLTMTMSGCATATATTNASGVYTITFGGALGSVCTITPPAGLFDPISRTYTVNDNITGADFTRYGAAGDIPRTLTLVNQFVVPGASGAMPLILDSQNNEASLSFTVQYPINPVATAPTFVCGLQAPGCSITHDTSVLGRVGVTIVPAGGAFSRLEGEEGETPLAQKHIATMNFSTVVGGLPNAPITFVDSPVNLVTRDAANNPLLTRYVDGLIVFAQGIEGDLATRNTGNGTFESGDVVLIRRFVAGLETPVGTHNEFQRADTAPASTQGDGNLNATDVVQTRRYVAGLDPAESANGPGVTNLGPMAAPTMERSGGTSEISIGKASGSTNSRVTVPVAVRSIGDEVAVSFVIRYDAARLGNATVELANAQDGATLTANADEPGIIRVLVDAATPFARSKDLRDIVNVSFDIASKAPTGDTSIMVEETSVSDTNANSLAFRATNGTISIAGPNAVAVEISGQVLTPDGSGLRNAVVILTNAKGVSRSATTATFGYYRFEGVPASETFTLKVESRRYQFEPLTVNAMDKVSTFNIRARE